jgi:hypothetical protein
MYSSILFFFHTKRANGTMPQLSVPTMHNNNRSTIQHLHFIFQTSFIGGTFAVGIGTCAHGLNTQTRFPIGYRTIGNVTVHGIGDKVFEPTRATKIHTHTRNGIVGTTNGGTGRDGDHTDFTFGKEVFKSMIGGTKSINSSGRVDASTNYKPTTSLVQVM